MNQYELDRLRELLDTIYEVIDEVRYLHGVMERVLLDSNNQATMIPIVAIDRDNIGLVINVVENSLSQIRTLLNIQGGIYYEDVS